jgi:2'-5' RNA ligase
MDTGPRQHGTPPAAYARSCNLFFGVFPPPLTREAMAAQVARLREAAPVRGRWSDPLRYHVTVQFLGRYPVAATQAPDAEPLAAIRAAARSLVAPTFELQLDTTGWFSRSRVGWLGCTRPSDGLVALWRGLGEALGARAVAHDAAATYVPHVTVLRDARQAWPVQAIAPIRWPVSTLVLARSRGGPGPYEALETWPLG